MNKKSSMGIQIKIELGNNLRDASVQRNRNLPSMSSTPNLMKRRCLNE